MAVTIKGATTIRGNTTVGFSPASLFAAGEQGVWFDPSDFSTMFQDNAGTTPVTAVEQPVGLLLDKRGGPYGPNLIVNSDFSTNTWWNKDTGVTISGGTANWAATTSTYQIYKSGVLTAGKTYLITYTITSISSGGLRPNVGGTLGTTRTTTGTYTELLTANSTTVGIYSQGASTTASVDNVTIVEVSSNYATQATAGSRPTLSARVNLLTATATLSTQSVTTVATTYTLYFTGSGSITLSGTATGTFSAGSNSVSCTAGTLTLTVSGTVTTADLRPTNQGVGLPAYQRVNTSTDYDTTGFPFYLAFNGTTNSRYMVTGNINLSGTYQANAFYGVRPATMDDRMIAELGVGGSIGSFYLYVIGNKYSSDLKGTATINGQTGSYTPPITHVIDYAYDISQSTAANALKCRVNSADVSLSYIGTNAGSGNFGNIPLYIGARAGSSLYYNGNLYGLIIRGAASTSDQITATENWMNTKTRAY